MDLGLKGKVVIVTGGAKGIGAGISEVFAEEGANVVVNYKSDPELCEAFAKRIAEENGVQTVTMQGDIGYEDTVKALFDRAYEAFGKVDIVINNAGTYKYGMIEDTTLDDWRAIYRTNLEGMFLMCREHISRLLERKRKGHILNVLSKAAVSTNSSGNIDYIATKGGGLAMTRGIANECTPKGIICNAILPGYVVAPGTPYNTGDAEDQRKKILLPLGDYAQPRDMGNVAAFLCSEKASQIVGAIVDVTGGLIR